MGHDQLDEFLTVRVLAEDDVNADAVPRWLLHHATPNSVLAVTGGGVLCGGSADGTGVSATVLTRVFHTPRVRSEFIGAAPEQACSIHTARDIAMASWQRAATRTRFAEYRFAWVAPQVLRQRRPNAGTSRPPAPTLSQTGLVDHAAQGRATGRGERLPADHADRAGETGLEPNSIFHRGRSGCRRSGGRSASQAICCSGAGTACRSTRPRLLFPGVHPLRTVIWRWRHAERSAASGCRDLANNVDSRA
jgi:hypothetical protein